MKKSLRYSVAAIVMAFAVIGTTLYANSIWGPPFVKGQTNFLVMLTDPPNVPKGTTELEVTYSNIELHVVPSNGPSNWVDAQESGKVDLLSLVDVKQTIASVNLATGSSVDKLQFTISSAKATIDGVEYPVTILTDQLVVSLRGGKLTGATIGALIDLRPTLVMINASDANGEKVSYYVLVPSATAVIETNVGEDLKQIGAKSHLDDDENEELDDEYERTNGHIVITDASLSVSGEETTLSVTLENTGEETASIGGLEVKGDFKTDPTTILEVEEDDDEEDEVDDDGDENEIDELDNVHDGILFKISGDKLVPLLWDDDDEFDHSKREINAGESITLTFSGVIKLALDDDDAEDVQITVTPIEGNIYSMRPLGNGSELYDVTAS